MATRYPIASGSSSIRAHTNLRRLSQCVDSTNCVGGSSGIVSNRIASSTSASSSSTDLASPSLYPHPSRTTRRTLSSTSSNPSWLPNLPFSSSSSSARRPASILASAPIRDPISLLSHELGSLRSNVQSLLGSGHPALDTIAKYYFQAEGKHIRPMVVLLMSQATNGLSPDFEKRRNELNSSNDLDQPLTNRQVLNDENPDLFQSAKAFFSNPFSVFSSSSSSESDASTSTNNSNPNSSLLLLPTQRRLAEITEMIHVASLLHDDVIDLALTRRGSPSAPSLFGNKLSVLAGDFLLARASLALSRLGSNEVVELVASVLANLVEGEVMQMKGNVPTNSATTSLFTSSSSSTSSNGMHNGPTPEIFEHYMKKTYLKTASLIAKSTRATTVLGGCGIRQGWAEGEKIKDIAYSYGRNLGIAFQLIDDMLDFTASAAELGKPGQGADLKLGLATAPALYAWEEFPELGLMIERKFNGEDDVERAKLLIAKSSGAERTRELAAQHSKAAIEALQGLPESDARTELERIARDTLVRKK